MWNCYYWTFHLNDHLCYLNRNISSTPYFNPVIPNSIGGKSKRFIHNNNNNQDNSNEFSSSSSSSTREIRFEPLCSSITCSNVIHSMNFNISSNLNDLYSPALKLANEMNILIISFGLDFTLENEGNDRNSIDLPIGQYEIIKQFHLKFPNKPIICLFIHGSSFTLKNIYFNCHSILDLWYGGIQIGNSLAKILFGKISPSGKSPLTWYYSNEELPKIHNQMDWYENLNEFPKRNGLSYRYYNGIPQISFGFGLSYTKFYYSNIQIKLKNISSSSFCSSSSSSSYNPINFYSYENNNIKNYKIPLFDGCDSIEFSLEVKNIGNYSSEEIILVYLEHWNSSVPVPNIRLVEFTRISSLSIQESKLVEFSIQPKSHCSIFNGDFGSIYRPERIIERGYRKIVVGGGFGLENMMEFLIFIETTRNLSDCPRIRSK